MCGILGYIGPRSFDKEGFGRTLDVMQNRGPDDRGMFAIAIWDRLEKSLFLARDPMGIKPLYIWHRPEGLAFASEVKALRSLPDGPRGTDRKRPCSTSAGATCPRPLPSRGAWNV